MSVKVTFNSKEYELIYNEQSGLYEIEIEAPKNGGVYNAEIAFKDSIENIETSIKKIQIWTKEKNTNNFNCNYLNNSMLRRNSAIYDSNRYKK